MGNRTVGELGSACGASASCFFFLGAQARTLSAKSMATLTWQQGPPPREGRRVETGLAVRQREGEAVGRASAVWVGGGPDPRERWLGRGRPPPPWPAAAPGPPWPPGAAVSQIVTVTPEVSIMKVANPDMIRGGSHSAHHRGAAVAGFWSAAKLRQSERCVVTCLASRMS